MSFRRILAAADRILVCPVVYSEFMSGFDDTRRGRAAKEAFQTFLSRDYVEMPVIGKETGDYHSMLFKYLKEKGTPIPQNDIWIAASALEHGACLLTTDPHFKGIPTLRTEYPQP
jgi:tRNA(fMet)-specific endonuclease VapC